MATSVRAHCRNCGLSFARQGLINAEGTGRITLSNVMTPCPRCGATATVEDGVYDAIGKIVEAVRASTTGRDGLVALRSVAEAVQSGDVSFEDATKKIQEISSSYLALWNWINSNGAGLGVVIGILTVCIAYYAVIEANVGSDQAHIDATAQTQATEIQSQTVQNVLQEQQRLERLQEKVYELLAHQQQGAQSKENQASLKSARPKVTQSRTQTVEQGKLNRHERRRAAKLGTIRGYPQ